MVLTLNCRQPSYAEKFGAPKPTGRGRTKYAAESEEVELGELQIPEHPEFDPELDAEQDGVSLSIELSQSRLSDLSDD